MLRSFLNSVRGRSAVDASAVSNWTPMAYRSWERGEEAAGSSGETETGAEALPAVTASAATVRPERCCVYCGHGVYAPPRVARLRCPKCFADLSVQDIVLTGEVAQGQIVTAGKITVAEDAQVAATLVAARVDIAGRVLGDVLASNTCTIRETGKQAGRILCRHLDLRPGAEIEGTIELIRG